MTKGWFFANATDEQLADYFKYKTQSNLIPPTLANLLFAFSGCLAITVFGAMGLIWAWPAMVARTWIGMGVLAGLVVVAAGAAFWARELKKLWIYPIVEIAAGIALATQVATSKEPIIALLGFVSAVRLTLDGTVRLLKFRRAYVLIRKRLAKA